METLLELMHKLAGGREMLELSGVVIRLIVAAVLGGIIGFEREVNRKPAGLRTNMFICFGAAMYTVLSAQMAGDFTGDHTRIAAQIIPGIGFIGAGAIMRSGVNVIGLTSAATMFVVASIGMAAGDGRYLQAIFATIIVLSALEILGVFERRFNLKAEIMKYEVTGKSAEEMTSEITTMLEKDHRLMESVETSAIPDGSKVHFGLYGTRSEHKLLLARLKELPSVKAASFMGTREHE
jgi:putative Mg2+ transporter-C (MgtC) family protein